MAQPNGYASDESEDLLGGDCGEYVHEEPPDNMSDGQSASTGRGIGRNRGFDQSNGFDGEYDENAGANEGEAEDEEDDEEEGEYCGNAEVSKYEYHGALESDESNSEDESDASDSECDEHACFLCRYSATGEANKVTTITSLMNSKSGIVSDKVLRREAGKIQTQIEHFMRPVADRHGGGGDESQRRAASGAEKARETTRGWRNFGAGRRRREGGGDGDAGAAADDESSDSDDGDGARRRRERERQRQRSEAHARADEEGAQSEGNEEPHRHRHRHRHRSRSRSPESEGGAKRRRRSDSGNRSKDGDGAGRRRDRGHGDAGEHRKRQLMKRAIRRHNKHHSLAPQLIIAENVRHLRRLVRMYSKRTVRVNVETGVKEPCKESVDGLMKSISALNAVMRMQPERMSFYTKGVIGENGV